MIVPTIRATAQPQQSKIETNRHADARIEVSHLRDRFASLFHELKYSDAEATGGQVVALAERELDGFDPLLAAVLDDYAGVLEVQHKIASAIVYKQRSFKIWQHLADALNKENVDAQSVTEINSGHSSGGSVKHSDDERAAVAGGLCLFEIFAKRNRIEYPAGLPMQAFRIAMNTPDWDPEREALCLNMISMLLWPEHRIEAKIAAQRCAKVAAVAENKSIYPEALSWIAKMAVVDCDFLTTRDFAQRAIDADLACAQPSALRVRENLAELAEADEGLGDFAPAISTTKQLLLITEATDYYELFSINDDLACLYCFVHDTDKAQLYGAAAEQIASHHLGMQTDEHAIAQSRLGWIAFLNGDLGEARERMLTTIAHFSGDPSKLEGFYCQLNRIDAKAGDWSAATTDAVKAADLFESSLQQKKGELLLPEQIALVKDQVRPIMRALIDCAHHGECGPIYSRLCVLKNLVFDNLVLSAQVNNYCRSHPNTKEVFRQCAANEQMLAGMRLQKAGASNDSELIALTEKNETQLRSLLADATNDEAGTPNHETAMLNCDQLRKHIQKRECFVDVYKYVPLNNGQAEYCAFILCPDAEPKMVDIGNASDVEGIIQIWLKSIRSGKALTVTKLDRTTREVVSDTTSVDYPSSERSEIQVRADVARKLKPLLQQIKSYKKCVASLDGELYRVPWKLLLPGDTQFIEIDSVSQFAATTAASKPVVGNEVLVVSDVKYRHASELKAAAAEGKSVAELAEAQKFHVTPLKQSHADRESVMELLSKCTYAHMATHGYFIDQQPADSDLFRTYFGSRNALLESGILTVDDRPVTAQDFISIDLTHCEQVTLSACDTGVGETTFTGEGIVGLRSAIAAAGAKTLLVSLWPVDDSSTAELMRLFYTNRWKNHELPSIALAEAQSRLVELHPEWSSPYFWAGWIIIGRR